MYQNSKSGVVLKMVIKSTSLTSDFLLEVEVCQKRLESNFDNSEITKFFYFTVYFNFYYL